MLTKRQRQLLRQLQSRHGRRKSDLFLVEGVRCCAEALRLQPSWLEFTVVGEGSADEPGIRRLQAVAEVATAPEQVTVVPNNDLTQWCDTETPQGILCVMRRPKDPVPAAAIDAFSLVLDRVREPGNLGTILRTAWAAGLSQVWLTDGCADPFSAKVIRAGMGAQFALSMVHAGTLADVAQALRKHGRDRLYLAVPGNGVSCFSEDFQLAGSGLVLGNEAGGVADLSLGPHVTIPMPGHAESLNVSQAATILIFEGVRRELLS